jgi:hypothetical protein
VKLALSNTIANPVKAHIDSFGPFLFDDVVGDTRGGAVVSLDGSRRLQMAKFFETNAYRACFSTIMVHTSDLSFGVAGHDFARRIWQNTLIAPLGGGSGSLGSAGLAGSRGKSLR